MKMFGDTDKFKPFPAMIGDLAKMFDETKFFGYLQPSLLTALMDISEFGLQPKRPKSGQSPVGPRFYMTYLDQVWFFLFAPGTRNCIVGYSDDIIRNGDSDKIAADETAIAQEFDVRLNEAVSGGMGTRSMVNTTNKLGGWAAMTAQSSLEYAQYADAIMTLPGAHPAYRGLMEVNARALRPY